MAEEVDSSIIKKTQEILGSVIKKPPLTEKNLKRPPFRFLHDVITNVIKTSGFMKGLYAPEEMLSENIKDKESKIAYLQKAIDLLSLVTSQPVNLKPTKVVAGHEAQKTNEFLQILGAAAKSKVDTKEAVQTILQKSSPIKSKERRVSVDKRSNQKNAAEKSHVRSTTKTIDPGKKASSSQSNTSKEAKGKDTDKTRSHSKDRKTRDKEKPKDKSRSRRDDSRSRDKSDVAKDKSSKHTKDNRENVKVPVESPQKKPLLLQNGHSEDHELAYVPPVDEVKDNTEITNGEVMLENEVTPKKELTIEAENELEQPNVALKDDKRPQQTSSGHQPRPPSARSKRTKLDTAAASSSSQQESKPAHILDTRSHESVTSPLQRPSSARPSSSRPAPPRIRIRHIVENEEPSIRPETAKPVENVIVEKPQQLEDDDDETFIVSEEQSTDILEPHFVQVPAPEETPDEEKGSLVKQLLETKKDLEGGSQLISKKVEIDQSQISHNRSRESSNKELEQMQAFIQSVSKTAYPLGRMLDYLQEDVDSMKMELRTWQDEHKQNLAALRKEKSVTESALQPLRVQLDDLDQLVQDQIDANSALKATILRNEERIQRMLASVCRKS